MSKEHQAFGYVRTQGPDDEQFDSLRLELLTFCRRAGLRLINVFYDYDPEHEDAGWLGFAHLLNAVRQRPGSVVAIPDVTHLGTDEQARQTYLTFVMVAKAQLWIVRHPQLQGVADTSAAAWPPFPLSSGESRAS